MTSEDKRRAMLTTFREAMQAIDFGKEDVSVSCLQTTVNTIQ